MKKSKKKTKEAKAVLARVLGVEEDRIQVVLPKWFDLMKEGVLVSLHIGRWRAKSKLSFADLGLPELEGEKASADLLSLGTKFLLPVELVKKADAIESRARKTLKKKAFQTYWGAFVGVSGFAEIMEELEAIRSDYLVLRDEIVDNYDGVRDRLALEYHVLAEDAYRRLALLSPEAASSFEGPDVFVETFLENSALLIPSAKEIGESFRFSIDLSYIPLPSLLEADRAEAERAQAALETDLEAERVRRRRIIAFEEAEALKAEVSRRAAVAGRDIQFEAEEKKRELLDRMNEEIVSQARSQKEELVEGFLSQIVGDLRAVTFEAASDVLGSIKRNETLVPRSVVQLRGVIDRLDKMNFLDDHEINKMIAEIRTQVDTASGDRDVDTIRRSLEDIALVTRADLVGLGETVRSVRGIGLSDNPSPATISRARRDLGLDTIEIESLEIIRAPRMKETIDA